MNRLMKGRKWIPLAVGAGVMVMSTQVGLGQEEEELPFDEAQLYFELNHTDSDLGIHGLIDGDAWKSLAIEGPNADQLMNVWIRGNLRKQGMTEFFFESAEPNFGELSPAAFFKRFPAGIYEFEGITLEDEELESELRLSHVMAGPPSSIKINGKNAAKNCDVVPLPIVSEPVTLDWSPVTRSHPTVGKPNVNVTVQQYQVVGEIEREGTPDVLVLAVDLPPNVTAFEFPEDFTGMADGEMKFEIVIKLKNGNQTAVESCFEID